ncbi:MAG: TetR/AcrR family transcriptional regulator [Kibdelosporangium sp.]
MDETARRVLDAAESLFYERGIQAVGMDEIRNASGVSLKRLYLLFPSKERLVVGYLERRDKRWRESLATYVQEHDGDKVMLVFDWLHNWFSEPDFRGCAFINSFGEMGTTSTAINAIVRHHKDELKRYIEGLVHDPVLAWQVLLLIDGASTLAAINGDPGAAHHAKAAAAVLIR